jgi:hypothetical protein
LPGLIDLYEAHKKDREKFEILAFHDATVKGFADLDEKMVKPRERYWGGRALPFPILLDATGQTIKDWGVHAFPTTLLIDPEGKLVGHAGEAEFEKKLPPLPMSVRVARALDRNLPAFVLKDNTLEDAVKLLSRLSNLPIRLDRESLRMTGVASDSTLPLDITASITLRSALHLTLEAFHLGYEADEKGLVIKTREAGAPSPSLSPAQRAAQKRIEKALEQKVSFDFNNKPLQEVARFFDARTQDETVILSPFDRKAGLLDPNLTVSGSAKDVPLREVLTKLLGPRGIKFVIRDEVIVLTVKRKTEGN